jgi:mono/diheme cytochrome c family protein
MRLFKLALVFAALLSFAAACNNSPADNAANANARAASTPSSTNAATPSAPAATPDEFASARDTFKAACVRCHKADGTGGPTDDGSGKPLKVPSLREGGALKMTDAQMVKKIQNGGDGMPQFKTRLDQEKIDSLVRFIRHDFQGQTAPAGTASPTPKH